ncbi:hypothetical protein FOZ60_009459 [Perkinsus olseni]|uniref:Uncharacterized protein n=1 Tax=Perkinsus olseni TaxID=32597 RepID=A0A7J6PF72_PEROL|nr:hypothetical protein FOZ60_009459 [Perkinsus olseni]
MLSRFFGEDSQGEGHQHPQHQQQPHHPADSQEGRDGGLQRSAESIESAGDWRSEELQDMQMKLDSAMERLNRESTLADQLRAALSNKEGEAEQLQQTVQMLQTENNRLSTNPVDDGDVKKLRNRVEEQEAKITALQSALEEAHTVKEPQPSQAQQNKEEDQGLREELGQLKDTVDKYQAELQRREGENSELRDRLAEAQRAEEDQHKDLAGQVSAAEKTVEELRQELQEAHRAQAAAAEKYEARIEELERANSPKREDGSSMASSYEVVDLEPSAGQHSDNTPLQEPTTEASRMAEEDKAALRAELAERTEKVEELQNSVEQLQQRVGDITAQLKESEAGRERTLQELSEAALTLRDQQKNAEEGEARAGEEAESLRRELQAKEATYNDLLQRVEALRAQIEGQAKELVLMTTDKAAEDVKYKEEMADLKDQLQQAIGRSNLADGLEEELSDAQMALTEAQDREATLQEAAEKAKAELTKATAECTELNEKINALQSSLATSNHQVEEYEKSAADLQASVNALKDQAVQRPRSRREAERQRADTSRSELEETKKQLAELKAGDAAKDKDMEGLRARLEEMHEEFAKAQDDLCSAESMIEEYDQDNRAKGEHIGKLTEALEARDDFISQVTDYRDLLVKDVAVLGGEAESRAALATDYHNQLKAMHEQLVEAHKKGATLAKAWQQSGADKISEVREIASKAAASLKAKDEMIVELKEQYQRLADKYADLAERRQRDVNEERARKESAAEASRTKLSSVVDRAQRMVKSAEDDDAEATSRTEAYITSILGFERSSDGYVEELLQAGETAKILAMLQTERRKRRSAEEALEKVSAESAGQEPSAAASRRLAVHLARHVQDLTATIKELKEKQGEEKSSSPSIEKSDESTESLESLQRESSRLRRSRPERASEALPKRMASLSALMAQIVTTPADAEETSHRDEDEESDLSPSHAVEPLPSSPASDEEDTLAGLLADTSKSSEVPPDCSAAIQYFQDLVESSIPDSPRFEDVDLEHTSKAAGAQNESDLPAIPTLSLARADVLRSETDGWSTQVAPSVVGGHPESTIGDVPPPNRVDETSSSDGWDNFAANTAETSQAPPPSSSSASSGPGEAWSTERQGSIATTTEVAAASSQPEATRDMEGADGGTGGARPERARPMGSTGSEGLDFAGSSAEESVEPERLQAVESSPEQDNRPEATQRDADVADTTSGEDTHHSGSWDEWPIEEDTSSPAAAAARQPESTEDVSSGSLRLHQQQQDEEDAAAPPEERRPGGATDPSAHEAPSKTPEIVAAVPEEEMMDAEDTPDDHEAALQEAADSQSGSPSLEPPASPSVATEQRAPVDESPVGSTQSPTHAHGVVAPADDAHGVVAPADDGHGVVAPADDAHGVVAPADDGHGVVAPADDAHGVVASADDGHGVVAPADDGHGVVAPADDGHDGDGAAPSDEPSGVVPAGEVHHDSPVGVGSDGFESDGNDEAVPLPEPASSAAAADFDFDVLDTSKAAADSEQERSPTPWDSPKHAQQQQQPAAPIPEKPLDLGALTEDAQQGQATPWDDSHDDIDDFWGAWEDAHPHTEQQAQTSVTATGAEKNDAESHELVDTTTERCQEAKASPVAQSSPAPVPHEIAHPAQEAALSEDSKAVVESKPLHEAEEPTNLWDETEVDSLALDGWDDHVESPHRHPASPTAAAAQLGNSEPLWSHSVNAHTEPDLQQPSGGWSFDQESPRAKSADEERPKQEMNHLPTTAIHSAAHHEGVPKPVSDEKQQSGAKGAAGSKELDDDFWDLLNSA